MPMTELPPLDGSVPPRRHPRTLCRARQRPARAYSRSRRARPSLPIAAARFSRARLFLAQDHGPLAAAGYHVVAPDLRGYGRTTGWSANYDDDLRPFRHLNAVRDALGHRR